MKTVLICGLGVLMMVFSVRAGDRPQVGSMAPDFTLQDADGAAVTLSGLRGSVVVLYFYPRDNTPGCTREACNLRDHFDSLRKKGIIILGVSYDSAASHRKFRDKYRLPFTLLSDKGKTVAEKYGVKGLIGAKRVTFLIGSDGRILHVFDDVDVGAHADQILAELNKDTGTPAKSR